MVPQTLSRMLLPLSLLSASLLLTGCPGLRHALPSMVAATQPDVATAHEFTLPDRDGDPVTMTTVLPVVGTLHAHNHDDDRGYRIESAMLNIADLTHPRRVAFLPISLSDIARLRNDIVSQKSFVPHLSVQRWDKTFLDIYTDLADHDRLRVLPLAGPTDPVPIEQRVDRVTHSINAGDWHR